MEFSYQVTGHGPALVLLHGLGSCADDWAPQCAAFSSRYRVITPDLLGHGATGMPAEASIQMMSAQVLAILDAEGVSRAHVVGLSLGGAVALQLAIDCPDRLASLAIINSRPDFRPQSWRDYLMVAQRSLLIRLLSMRRLGQILGRRLFPQDVDKQGQFAERLARQDKRTYLQTLKLLLRWNMRDGLANISCPTLIVRSEHDYYPLDQVHAYAAEIPQAEVAEINSAHHAVTLEYPERFNALLGRFLEEVVA